MYRVVFRNIAKYAIKISFNFTIHTPTYTFQTLNNMVIQMTVINSGSFIVASDVNRNLCVSARAKVFPVCEI